MLLITYDFFVYNFELTRQMALEVIRLNEIHFCMRGGFPVMCVPY